MAQPLPDSERHSTFVANDDGRAFQAEVLVGEDGLIVLSRSGKDTNREYRPALEAILARLARAGAKPTVYLDSKPNQHRPLAERLLARPRELTGNPADQFSLILSRMNAGGTSHGAYRRLFLSVPKLSAVKLLRLVTYVPTEAIHSLTPAELRRAAQAIAKGEPTGDFGKTTKYSAQYGLARFCHQRP